MAEVDTVHATQPTNFAEADQPIRGPDDEYTPGDFVRECSTVIAACLGLATLAHLVVFMVGD